jgi:hypothetical protein
MFGSNREYLKAKEEVRQAKNDSIRERKNMLEEIIMTINEIQDIQALGISEREKDIMRNNIINCKRSDFVSKIIELDRYGKSI